MEQLLHKEDLDEEDKALLRIMGQGDVELPKEVKELLDLEAVDEDEEAEGKKQSEIMSALKFLTILYIEAKGEKCCCFFFSPHFNSAVSYLYIKAFSNLFIIFFVIYSTSKLFLGHILRQKVLDVKRHSPFLVIWFNFFFWKSLSFQQIFFNL